MVDYNIQPVQIPNFAAGIGNAMDDRYKINLEMARANHLARQDEVALQNEMLRLKSAQTAEANAAYEKKRRDELMGVMQGFGVTPAVVGRPGQSYSGTGVANDPYADISNKLIGANFVPQAEAVLKAQNEGLTGKKIGAETTKIGAETTGILSDNERKAAEARAAQFKEYGDAILRAGSVPEVNALIDSHAQALTELGIPPEQAKKNFLDAYQRNGGDNNPEAFTQTLMQSSQGAMVTSKHLADIAHTNAQTYQANASGTASLAQADKATGDLKLAQDKQAWEQNHPGYELRETAQGWVAINKNNPNDVTLIKLGNEPAMPINKATNIPAGYRMAANGTSMEVIPGGPADAKQLAAANVKLEPGQKLDENGNIVNMPNSRIDAQQRKAHAGDAKKIETVNVATDSTLSNIDQILDPKKSSDFDANFGYGSSFTSKTPGARDVAAKIDNIKAALKSLGLEDFRVNGSIGAMTEKEWPIVQDRIAALKDNMSPEAARQTLADIKDRLNMMRNIAHDSYDNQWGASQYYKPDLTKNSTTNIFNAADAIIGGK
jgi:hypothetical protein